MRGEIVAALLIAFIVAVVGLALGVRNYIECRAHGFSRIYCIAK